MLSLKARALLPPLAALACVALGLLVDRPWYGLALAALVACALALWLSAHLHNRLLAIRATVVSGLVRPHPTETSSELDALADAVQRFVNATSHRQRGDREELEHQTFLLDRMHDGLMRVAADGRVRYANPAAGALLGGRNPTGQSFLRVTRDHELHTALITCLTTGSEQQQTVELPRAGRLISVVIARVDDDPPEALVMLRDITEVNRLQHLRRDFVANVSHELRTPLSTIKILAETLLDLRPDDATTARYLTKLDSEIDVMTALVRDLLDLSRLEAHAQAGLLNVRETDVAQLLADVRERMLPIAERDEVTLTEIVEGTDTRLLADERRLHQALTNLVSNALAHTPAGGTVTLSANLTPAAVVFSVRDTGAGIAPDDLERVWERFFKTDRSRASGGAGLGLAIVKHIVLAHGGAVDASSTPGEGSEFRLTLPRRSATSART
jgi:two-component system phosphate regulon sensor histidine kinase PhoR